MDLGIPALKTKILLESKPLKFRTLVRRLAVFSSEMAISKWSWLLLVTTSAACSLAPPSSEPCPFRAGRPRPRQGREVLISLLLFLLLIYCLFVVCLIDWFVSLSRGRGRAVRWELPSLAATTLRLAPRGVSRCILYYLVFQAQGFRLFRVFGF